MALREYLPSSKFASIALSIGMAGALIVIAQYATRPAKSPADLLSGNQAQVVDDWKAALDEVQSSAPGLPSTPDEGAIQELLDAAQSSNVTSSVARSLFVNLTDAGTQGLGSDIPTQERLIADASARIGSIQARSYTAADLQIVAQTKDISRAWGNDIMSTFSRHPRANHGDTLYLIGYAMDYSDKGALESLRTISDAYAALAEDLSGIPVPSTYAPLYLQLINNLSQMSAAAAEMEHVLVDPLRALSGLQAFQTSGNEASRVLTTLADQFSKGGILFTKDEPGNLWNSFLSSP